MFYGPEKIEKEIVLKLVKIYNWPIDNEPVELELRIYSKKSSHLISRKCVKSITNKNKLDLNLSIIIRYALIETTIVIVIRQGQIALGEIDVDLDSFIEKKVRYFSFAEDERIMQVETDDPPIEPENTPVSLLTLHQRKEKNSKFLEERQKFIQKYNKSQNELKNQFETRLTAILNQNGVKLHSKNDPKSESYIDDLDIHHSPVVPTVNEIGLKRVRSAVLPTQVELEIHQSNTSSKVNIQPKKHKLVLNTLNIVPKEERV